ncbi:hypothetical protein ACVI1I_003494 [Bradyrhizobium sp. USDA 4459]
MAADTAGAITADVVITTDGVEVAAITTVGGITAGK